MRTLTAVFGSTPYATATILTALLLGPALGALVLGRKADRSDRPLALYAHLEIGIGLYGLVFPWIVAWMSSVYVWFYRAVEPGMWVLAVVRLGLSTAVLPGAFLMGGLLPALVCFLGRRHPEAGREAARLYATAVTGTAAGCLASGFFLLPAVGVRRTAAVAACTAIAGGLLALGLARIKATAKTQQTAEAIPNNDIPQTLKPKTLRLLLPACGIAGFCSLACKMLWDRALVYNLGASPYSSAAFLTVLLMCIAIGMHISARFIVARFRSGVLSFGTVQMLTGPAILVSVVILQVLPAIHIYLRQLLSWTGSWRFFIMRFGEASVVAFGPMLLTGAAMAIATALCLSAKGALGRRAGHAFSAYIIGCILGWPAATFLVLPMAGVQYGLLGVAAVSLAAGILLTAISGVRPIRLGAVVALSVVVVAIAILRVMPSNLFFDALNLRDDLSRITFINESSAGNVTVHDLPNGRRRLAVDGVDIGRSDIAFRTMQKLQAYIPLCLHANPKRVLQIGCGCGETIGAGLEFAIDEYTVVEPRRAVFDAAKCFEQTDRDSQRDSRFRKVVADGRSFTLLSNEMFDIIISDTLHPGLSGFPALFTADYFRNCRKRLRSEGLFACRLPLGLQPPELCAIIADMKDVFAHTSVWRASNCLNMHVLIIAGNSPLCINLKRIKTLMQRPEIARGLAAIEIYDAYDLLDCHLCDDQALGKMLTNLKKNARRLAWTNCDDLPLLEFNIANLQPELHTRQALSVFAMYHVPVTDHILKFAEQDEDLVRLGQRFEATRCILQAQIAELLNLPQGRKRWCEVALKANPDEIHVQSCQAELEMRIRELQQAAKAKPDSCTIAQQLADKLFIGLRYQEAAEIYDKLVALKSPPSPGAFVNLAEIRHHSGQTEQAEALLRRCLDRWPNSAEAHDRLGGIYFKMGRLNAARHHAREAVRIEPTNALYLRHFQKTNEIR
ncbi:MAG: spermine/spermidine synthase domain-containing protein [Planctomycetota bacterium]